ncbi:NlpC/P60 family protein [Actinomyces sp. oral taxon 848 str. F0332]|nr:NlpC/P60 family protein [Actinomyces sp. oral taxon 848 str. F0332]
MSIRKWYKGASGAIALALSAAVVLPARADDGGDADIAASKEAEQRTKADISNTEARLTQIGVKANKLKVGAAKAEAASIAAQQRLSTSIGEAMGAQDAVDSADKQVDAARRQLSGISTSIYKHGARAVAGGRFSLGAADYRQAREKARAYRILANKTNRDLQRFKSARFEAATLQKKADDKAAAEKDVAHKADEASAEASRVASNAETEIRTISAERDRLISKLAAQKGTTAELVRRQQDEKEAAAKAEAEQESQRVVQTANERALRAASQEAAEQTSPQQADGQQAGPQQAESSSAAQAAPAAEGGEKPAAADPSASQAAGSQAASQPTPAQEKAPAPEKPSGQEQAPAAPAAREKAPRAEAREQSQASKRAEAERQRQAQAAAQRRAQAAAAQRQAQQAAAEKQAAAQKAAEQRAAAQAAAQKQAQERAAAEAARQKQAQAGGGSSSAVGAQIVAYARQFAGVRYVWGGTNPSSGWDCVGFTHYVYAHFGRETPRRTGSYLGQFWKGYKVVPASQRQPGDLMWWPGHTGIYTGNNMHIAAWNPSMGTQERKVWGSPVYLRIVG